MLQSYLKIAFRTLWQNRLYSVINVVGLSVGIACVLLAILYIKDEQSFDRFHERNPHLYRITTTLTETKGGLAETNGGTGQVQGPTFKAQVPEVQDYVRVMGGDIQSTFVANQKSSILQPFFVDSTFFNVFSFRLLSGNPETALRGAGTVVVTERTARKLFNSLDVIGKVLLEDGPSGRRLGASIITGVVQDPPKNSSLQFDLLFPFRFMQASFDDTSWLNSYLSTFVVLHPRADVEKVVRKFGKVYAIHARDQVAENRKNYGFDPAIQYGLQPMTDIHLQPLYHRENNREGGVTNGSNPVFSYIFLGISAFILLMATINFINISLANSLKRTKEIGVRKVTGSSRKLIIVQFLGESAILCFIAFGMAVLLVQLALPVFNQLATKAIVFRQILDGWLLLYFIVLLIINVFLSGFYPAFVLAKFKPTEVLYNKPRLSGRNGFGQTLVMIQFALSVFLVIATTVFYYQMDYVRTKDLGYDPYQVIATYIPSSKNLKGDQAFLRSELANEPSIRQVSFYSDLGGSYETRVAGRKIESRYQYIDENYLSVLGIHLKARRNLLPNLHSDKSDAVLVNEAFVKAAGLEKPIGKQIRLHENFSQKPLTIVGVMKDFHARSLRERIPPMALFIREDEASGMLVKIDKNRQQEAITSLKKVFGRAYSSIEMDYAFLDEVNAKGYEQEQKWLRIVSYATGLALLICVIGVFGLAKLATGQRTKEIGVRKVLGATVLDIVTLLSKDFLKPVLAAIALASPAAAWVMGSWLQNFVYRVEIQWWMFAGAGLLAIGVTLLTVSLQSAKTALLNPVESLRRE
ncbi:ABC transporter permease [Larkinella terrae]|uniref:FtsX-like permease family protein n=1 Tax=Larkinella terrae TaxID=2025311 RepID=A0A7K0ERP8_9BACT|nr:ABC transporter permease [Larkinella terrae]MRS64216.1 FtsX-like permease family protein [Larkinella terrae]